MNYSAGYKLDEQSRATQCPKCENAALDYRGDYCKICGTYLINKCSYFHINDHDYHKNEDVVFRYDNDCSTLLDGDARFCTECGNESTYYRQKLLAPWQEHKHEIEFEDFMNSPDPFSPQTYTKKSTNNLPF